MKKHTVMLLGLFLLLAIIAYAVLQRPGETSVTVGDKELLIDADSAAINKYIINSQYGEIVLEKEGTKWYLTKPIRYPADERKIATVISASTNMELKNVVSTNPKKQSVYQVDSNGTQVRIFENGNQSIDMYVGKAASTPLETFVRRSGSDKVLLVKGALSYVMKAPLKDWRDKTILQIPQNELTRIEYQYSNETFVLEKRDTLWFIGDLQANRDEVNSLLKSLSDFTTDFFTDEKPKKMPEITCVLGINNRQLQFMRLDDERVYVRSSESPQLFMVLNWKATQVLKNKEDFLGEPS